MDADKFLMIGDTTYEVTERHTSNEYAPPKRRSRRGSGSHAKKEREKWGREEVLTQRDCLRPGWERKATERERVEATRRDLIENGQPTKKVHRYRKDEYEGIPNLNLRRLEGVETHPVAEYAKSRSYPHQPLENPTHLWCDEVHASDKDVLRGNRKKG